MYSSSASSLIHPPSPCSLPPSLSLSCSFPSHSPPSLSPLYILPPSTLSLLPPSLPPSLSPLSPLPYADFLDRMGVWILDGVVWHSQLLPFVLKRDTLSHTMVMIVVDLSLPWNVMDSLEQWAEVVRKHINSLQVPSQDLREMEENSEIMVCVYVFYQPRTMLRNFQ